MSRFRDNILRRDFLARAWKWGLGLIGAAGLWTSWDVLRPPKEAGIGGLVEAVPPADVPDQGVLYVSGARAYLTRIDDEVVALSETCPHLSCRVPWCEQAGEFECPCHGSFFNRAGDHAKGPSPRGMDRYAVEIVDGKVVIDTGTIIEGQPPGTVTLDEPPIGPPCTEE
jgi:cytochrome b6-f complex iron-sulfur subunit